MYSTLNLSCKITSFYFEWPNRASKFLKLGEPSYFMQRSNVTSTKVLIGEVKGYFEQLIFMSRLERAGIS